MRAGEATINSAACRRGEPYFGWRELLCSLLSRHIVLQARYNCFCESWSRSTSSSRETCLDCVLQRLSPTAEVSLSFELNDATATQSTGNLPTRSPVNMTLYFPSNGDQAYFLQPCLHTPTSISKADPQHRKTARRSSEHAHCFRCKS